jgi:hypothetical protein
MRYSEWLVCHLCLTVTVSVAMTVLALLKVVEAKVQCQKVFCSTEYILWLLSDHGTNSRTNVMDILAAGDRHD